MQDSTDHCDMTPIRSQRTQYLFNLPFVTGLFLLLLNDHYLKGHFGNWFTGKLSDLAGLFIFPLFLQFLFQFRRPWSAVLLTALGFLYWKLPLADGLIQAINNLEWLKIQRVVDYSDFLAFVMLPLSAWFIQHIQQQQSTRAARPVWATAMLFSVSIMAFVATSVEDELYPYADSSINSCCVIPPPFAAQGDGNIFIPNVFTPDGDGLNDVFQVVANPGIQQIDTFEIRNIDNDSTLFLATDITDISSATGWDGSVNDTIVPAQYFYRIQLRSVDNTTDLYEGLVCCLPCVEPTGLTRPPFLGECVFSTQYDSSNGSYDSATPSGEALDCFE